VPAPGREGKRMAAKPVPKEKRESLVGALRHAHEA
jgi:hypothetical protein